MTLIAATRTPAHSTLFWLGDSLAALLLAGALAWGISTGIDAGGDVPWLAMTGIVLAGLLRAGCMIAAASSGQYAADAAKASVRSRIWPRTLVTPPGDRAMLGETVADGVDRIEDLNGYHAQFLPLRRAALLSPLLIALAAAPASWVASAIMLGTLVPFGLGMALAGTAAARAAGRQLEALNRLSGLFVDRMRALPVIVGFGAEDRVVRHLEQATRDVADRTLSVLRIAFLSGAVMEFFAALSVALVAVYCGFSLLGLLPFPAPEELTLARALFVLVLAPEFYLPMRRLAAAYHDKQIGEAALASLATAAPSVTPTGTRIAAPPALRFENIVIARGDARIGPISFSAPAGSIIAIRGPSGAGKSSLLHALIGLAPIEAGDILIDGRPLTPAELAGQVGWVGQAIALLPGTLGDNIRIARPDANAAVIEAAALRAGLGPLIERRGQGLAFTLDHAGSWLSGGERRRVGLARVLLGEAPLWLLDEPTADLDAASASDIAATLKAAAAGRTVLLATHDEQLARLANREVALA